MYIVRIYFRTEIEGKKYMEQLRTKQNACLISENSSSRSSKKVIYELNLIIISFCILLKNVLIIFFIYLYVDNFGNCNPFKRY